MTLYGSIYLAAILLFAATTGWMVKRAGMSLRVAALLLVHYCVGMVFCAHLAYFPVVERTLEHPGLRAWYGVLAASDSVGLEQLGGWGDTTGGLWGGPLFVLAGVLLSQVIWRIPCAAKGQILDILAVCFPLSYAVSKVACFANGCCFGREGQGALFVHFDWIKTGTPAYGRTLFPTQLLDVLILTSLGTMLALMYWRRRQRGKLVLWFALAFCIGRFVSEWTRGDHVGRALFGLSPVQVVLLGTLPLCGFFLFMPRAFDALLAWRAGADREPPKLDDSTRRSLMWHRRTLFIVLVLCTTLTPLLVLLPFLSFLPMIVGLVQMGRTRSWRAWSRVLNQFHYFALGFLGLVSFFVPNVLVGLVAVALFLVLQGLLMSADVARFEVHPAPAA